jgi:hypothetical protein
MISALISPLVFLTIDKFRTSLKQKTKKMVDSTWLKKVELHLRVSHTNIHLCLQFNGKWVLVYNIVVYWVIP